IVAPVIACSSQRNASASGAQSAAVLLFPWEDGPSCQTRHRTPSLFRPSERQPGTMQGWGSDTRGLTPHGIDREPADEVNDISRVPHHLRELGRKCEWIA